jgi:predicted nucleic acid-binding protein
MSDARRWAVPTGNPGEDAWSGRIPTKEKPRLSTGLSRQLQLRRASVAPLVSAAWSYGYNLTVVDALYVALAEQLGASLLTDDHRLVQAPTFPSQVPVLRLPAGL